MAEIFMQYGLFLAKAVTLVVALLFLVGGIVTAAARNRSDDEDGALRVRHLNRDVEALRDDLRHEILPDHLRKADNKAHKKQEKERIKAEKKAEKDAAKGDDQKKRHRTFVLDFDGDVRASAVDNLRREISAILQVADKEDEVMLRLESPGGLVHSYGFASSQLTRIRQHGLKLTICVDMVAASGGYMMACIADRIVAAPFAIVGSVGVVAQMPNFNRLLKKHDVDVELITAGEYKRTLTMFGENTDEDREKFKEEIEDTHLLFKDFVRENRPSLDVERIATGEHWFGIRGKELGLVDELMTSDEYLLEQSKERDLYEIRWEIKRKLAERLGFSVESAAHRVFDKWMHKNGSRWFQ